MGATGLPFFPQPRGAANIPRRLGRVIRNRWVHDDGLSRTAILGLEDAPEGIAAERLRAEVPLRWGAAPSEAHVLSVIEGRGVLWTGGEALQLERGVHVYLPPGANAAIEAEAGASLVHVSSPRARGRQLLLRDEAFVASCAVAGQALRWILTPQYLSRRVFLHHDPTLLSRAGHPVSWFHTTMFDVAGLPANAEGEPVFKMEYASRTEFNVCYEVTGEARVRMALHPYEDARQPWGPWERLDGESTYHLDEAELDPTGAPRRRRNKHEVYALGGHVSLFCLFDPAPTGVERHRPGEYSDYEPFSEVARREEYRAHQREIARFDAMVDRLSLAKARGALSAERGSEAWDLHQRGVEAQRALERALLAALAAEGAGREAIVERWALHGG